MGRSWPCLSSHKLRKRSRTHADIASASSGPPTYGYNPCVCLRKAFEPQEDEEAVMRASWIAVGLIVWGPAAFAQTPPEPGAQATPGQTNPERADPSTATPSMVSPPAQRSTPQDSSSRSPDKDMANAAEQRPKTGREARL